MADADEPIEVSYLPGAWYEGPEMAVMMNPLIERYIDDLVTRMNLPRHQHLVMTNPVPLPRRFEGISRVYVGDAIEGIPTQADLDGMTEWKGIHADRVLTWFDETTTDEHRKDTLRDWTDDVTPEPSPEERERRRRGLPEPGSKDALLYAGMNRAERRAYQRGNRR